MIKLSKLTRHINTLIGRPLTFTLLLNKISEVGNEFHIERLSEYSFYHVDVNDNWLVTSIPPLMFVRDEPSDLFKDICIREETEFDFVLDYPMNKKELLLKRKTLQDEVFPFFNKKLKNFISFNSTEAWVEIDKEVTRITGRINFKGYAGIAKLGFYEGLDTIEIEVISYKMNYEDDFKLLLNELAKYHSELILLLDQPTEVSLGIDQMSESSPQVAILQLRRLMERNNLPLAIDTILANPHAKISHEILVDDIAQIVNPNIMEISSNSSDLNWNEGGKLSKYFKGFTPTMFPEESFDYSLDTQENQFVKFSLEVLADSINKLTISLPTKFVNSKGFLEACLDTIEGYLNNPFFQQISPFRRISNSMVLQKKSGYKDFLRMIQEFELGISLESNVSEFDRIDGDLRPIHQLYEYWCYFSLLEILQKICGQPISSDIISKGDKGFSLNLRQKSESKVCFFFNNAEVNLFYNRDFKGIDNEEWDGTYDGGLYHPDFSLQIISNKKKHWLHFDSKYKLDYQKFLSMIRNGEDNESFDSDSSVQREWNYKRNDIYTAHAYRDAILGSRGVYILYPDNVEIPNIFSRNPKQDYMYNFPSVGAFPLRPGKHNVIQKQGIEEFLHKVLATLTRNDFDYQEEVGVIENFF